MSNKDDNKCSEAVTDEEKLNKFITSLIITKNQDLSWKNLHGLSKIRRILEQSIILQTKFPDVFKGKRQPFKTLLMFGPPGSGKTLIADIAAVEMDVFYIKITSGSLILPGFEPVEIVKSIFKIAKENTPAIILLDECDSYLMKRSDEDTAVQRATLNEMLIQLQDLLNEETSVFVIAATNMPWYLDDAVLRRFVKKFFVELPDSNGRVKILTNQMSETNHTISESEFEILAKKTERYTAAELQNLCQTASMEAVTDAQTSSYFKLIDDKEEGRRLYQACTKDSHGAIKLNLKDIPENALTVPPVSANNFNEALSKIKPKLKEDELQKYRDFAEAYAEATD